MQALRYDLTWGRYDKGLKHLPKNVQKNRKSKRAPVRTSLLPYWRDFHSLHFQRQLSANGPQPLTVNDISTFYNTSIVAPHIPFRTYFRFISALDGVYLQHCLEKNSQ